MNLQNPPQKPSPPTFEFKGFDDWFEIFRAGEQTDSSGRTTKFTQIDLDSIVKNHDEKNPAPLVIGHPKTDDPAYGWTQDLKREGDSLFAKARPTAEEFEEAVRDERYPNRSVSLMPDVDGGWRLRHIGFLGAKLPAVEGMPRLHSKGDSNALTFNFSAYDKDTTALMPVRSVLRDVKSFMRSVREWFIEKESREQADLIVPSWQLDHIDHQLDKIGQDFASSDFVENAGGGEARPKKSGTQSSDQPTEFEMDEKQKMQEQIDSLTATNETLKAAVESQEQQRKADAYAASLKEATTVVAALVNDGKLLPLQAVGLAEFGAALPSDDDGAFQFSEGEGDKKVTKQKTPKQFFNEFLGKLGKQITLGQHDDDEDVDSVRQNFASPDGTVVNPERLKLHQKALNYQAKHDVEYTVALDIVSKES